MTVTNHPLPEASFIELAEGGGSPAAMRRLGEAQRSKHLMLLHAIAAAAVGPEPGRPRSGPDTSVSRESRTRHPGPPPGYSACPT